ncbi:FRG domain-containing protein [Sunxiuqinia indica]|uniref:FRG domain-containing protein n=1 Tax=Sunxiuqinia indica TaxID=2692584 RepID=UPI00135ACDF6|nr:FRG domain-containing protein [Sunxiuqinia indica]
MGTRKIYQNDHVVQSWEELCEEVYHDSWKPRLSRYRSDYAFRGLSDASYELKNSFLRNCGVRSELEYHLLRNFRKYSISKDAQLSASFWRSLVMAQHHGLPTRLLDWTYSPFVAMHFATSNTEKFDIDGVIWKVDFVKANKLVSEPLNQLLCDEKCNAFTVEMLEENIVSLSDFDKKLGKDQVIFFEPPSLDQRIVNQYAFFSVMTQPTTTLDEWLVKHPGLYRRIIIPKELKWEVRDKLDQANITERVLFPGLDGLARWLKRHYQPIVGDPFNSEEFE